MRWNVETINEEDHPYKNTNKKSEPQGDKYLIKDVIEKERINGQIANNELEDLETINTSLLRKEDKINVEFVKKLHTKNGEEDLENAIRGIEISQTRATRANQKKDESILTANETTISCSKDCSKEDTIFVGSTEVVTTCNCACGNIAPRGRIYFVRLAMFVVGCALLSHILYDQYFNTEKFIKHLRFLDDLFDSFVFTIIVSMILLLKKVKKVGVFVAEWISQIMAKVKEAIDKIMSK